ncbi:MAG: mechanosensitive ion channel [Candidatus Bipolaricaulota bacterium]|nr:mechanosensitive ion channel [Candidatus Bipolaricaulota bacterium]
MIKIAFLQSIVYKSAVWQWLLAAAIVIFTVLFLRLIRGIGARRLRRLNRRTGGYIGNLLADLLERTYLLFILLIAVYLGSLALTLPQAAGKTIVTLAVLASLIQLGVWGSSLIAALISRHMRRRLQEDAATATTISALGLLGKIVLWTILLLLFLSNLGYDLSALIAGLGIGGIAVALALQNILRDLFASLSIVIDKPFVIGDFVIVGEYLGTVENIGLKTTRIRSLSGEQLIFANGDLLNSRIRNYKRMAERRIAFSIGVTYGTPYEKLQAIPGMIREIIDSQEKTRFDRAHFKEYGDFSLDFEIVYYVLVPDYNVYMDMQQEINMELYRRFEEEGIEFAYPTQTLYINRRLDPSPKMEDDETGLPDNA